MSMVQKTATRFEVDGVDCIGYVYRPAQRETLPACIVMAHGFGGTQQGSLASTAEDFAGAGFVVLTFDYRYFGESAGTPRQLISIAAQKADWHAAIRHARTLAGVDPERIALWGSSLSGGHVVEVAAEDSRIAAVVAQVPFNGFPRKVEGRTSAETRQLLRAMLKDWWHGRIGRPPHYVPAVAPRGQLAVMAFDEADAVIRSMRNDSWRNEITPRVLLDMMLWYRPGRRAHRVNAPLLVCLAERDAQTPSHLGRRIADRAPLGELRRYPCAHFDFYNEAVRRLVVADQIAFLRTHLAWPERQAAFA
ncbi:alpha/beta fold hydrolase [Cupriavidus sp. UGS-1]|nr:alpha/beta fold hydrolase [Cupriavidus sp. UGS-1]